MLLSEQPRSAPSPFSHHHKNIHLLLTSLISSLTQVFILFCFFSFISAFALETSGQEIIFINLLYKIPNK